MYNVVSSANSATLLDFTHDGRSFMYNKNSTGPKIYPWSTLDDAGNQSEQFPSMTTL